MFLCRALCCRVFVSNPMDRPNEKSGCQLHCPFPKLRRCNLLKDIDCILVVNMHWMLKGQLGYFDGAAIYFGLIQIRDDS
jgi:hypothetical protein